MDRGYGIRTLLMTDVVGSTRLWAAHPDAMPAAIERLETIAAQAVEGEGGVVVKRRGEGDSLFCVMPDPAAAARAAVLLNRALAAEPWPNDLDLAVRAAIHCGPAHTRGEDVYGSLPNRCARLREVGHAGQILLTGAAGGQVAPTDGFTLRDLGRHRLRDLDESENVLQVVAPGLATDFPPLRSLTALRNNLPSQTTAFVGRVALRAELLQRLEADRLTTLTGAGGAGKTRLALQLGAESIDVFPDGVWFVELAELTAEPAIVRAIGEACGHRDLPDVDAAHVLGDRLRAHAGALFVLDNAEHALAPIGRAISELMASAPGLRLLVTSREPLRIRGERVHRVPPLTVPPPGCDDPQAVGATEAGDLFLDRARLHLPEFALSVSNAAAVTAIVRRLDGIPLCLEMAASHIGYLGVDQIAARLHDRFALLDNEEVDVPARHRTMRETIAWQVDTLKKEEWILLQRLAAFAGGFTLEAAEAIGGNPPLQPETVLRTLRTLVEKSLVVATPDAGEMRYRLLETIAQYASDSPDGEMEAAMATLVDWGVATAEGGYAHLYGPEHDRWIARLDHSEASLRRALEWALTARDERAVVFAARMTRYWHFRGRFLEGRGFLERVVATAPPSVARSDVDNALGVFCDLLGDRAAAEEAYRRTIGSEFSTPAARARALANLGILANERLDYEAALASFSAAAEAAQAAGDAGTFRLAMFNRGVALVDLGRLDEAEAVIIEVDLLSARSEDETRRAVCLSVRASIAVLRGDVDGASALLRQVLANVGSDPDAKLLAHVLLDAAWVAARREDYAPSAFLLGGHDALLRRLKSEITWRNGLRKEWLLDRLREWSPDAAASGMRDGGAASDDALIIAAREVVTQK